MSQGNEIGHDMVPKQASDRTQSATPCNGPIQRRAPRRTPPHPLVLPIRPLLHLHVHLGLDHIEPHPNAHPHAHALCPLHLLHAHAHTPPQNNPAPPAPLPRPHRNPLRIAPPTTPHPNAPPRPIRVAVGQHALVTARAPREPARAGPRRVHGYGR